MYYPSLSDLILLIDILFHFNYVIPMFDYNVDHVMQVHAHYKRG